MNIRHSQSGIAMLEVLITLVVVSFGFLALLSMQMNMLQISSNSSQHFIVSSHAHDMGERIRANRDNDLEYDGKTTEDAKDCTVSSDCTMAEVDLWDWKSNLEQESLANPVGKITLSGLTAVIEIDWDERANRFDEIKGRFLKTI